MDAALPSSRTRSYLYLVAAVALLANPLYLAYWYPGDAVYRYEAVEVSPDGDDGLTYRAVGSGTTERYVRVDGILCTGTDSRECSLEYAVHEGDLSVNGSEEPRSYRYVSFDGRLYQPTVENGIYGRLDHQPADPRAALRNLARETDAGPRAVDAIESGSVYAYRELPSEHEVVFHDGSYYVVYPAAVKRYGPAGTACGSDGGGFCEKADDLRDRQRYLAGGVTLAGLLLVWRAWKQATLAG